MKLSSSLVHFLLEMERGVPTDSLEGHKKTFLKSSKNIDILEHFGPKLWKNTKNIGKPLNLDFSLGSRNLSLGHGLDQGIKNLLSQ
jgi:hypothetical protein